MRLVYSSARLETAEGVAELLRQNGIETTMHNGRGYKGTRRSQFSFRKEAEQVPEVWVLNNDDQVRARQLLRDAQLIDSTRDRPSYLVELNQREDQRQAKQRRGLWIRLGLLGILLAVAGTMAYTRLSAPRQDLGLLAGPFDGKARSIPAQVAVSGLQKGIDLGVMPVLCLSFDGAKPPQALMGQLDGNGKRIVPFNHCTRDPNPETGSRSGNGEPAEFIDITNFRASSPTKGLIDVNSFHHQQWSHYRTFEVDLVHGQWKIGKLTRHVSS